MRAWRCRLAADVRGGMDATLFNQKKINNKKTELKERDLQSPYVSVYCRA